jgi:hypothetical protein
MTVCLPWSAFAGFAASETAPNHPIDGAARVSEKNLRRHASAFLLLFFLHTPVCRFASEHAKRVAKFFEQLSECVARFPGLCNA